jgi:hypothetical protein
VEKDCVGEGERGRMGERAPDSTYIDWVFRKLTHIFNFPEDL